jgi:8-oxo-dGTP pyrophosphatase MutT (NUDIX family)
MENLKAHISSIINRYLTFFPLEKTRLKYLLDLLKIQNVDLGSRKTIPEGHLSGSALIFSPDYTRILLIFHPALNKWVFPGGHFETQDSIVENTALRECKEETGIQDPKLHPWHQLNELPIDIDIHPIAKSEKKQEDAHWHFDFRYIILANENDVMLNSEDILGLKWVELDQVDPNSDLVGPISKVLQIIVK